MLTNWSSKITGGRDRPPSVSKRRSGDYVQEVFTLKNAVFGFVLLRLKRCSKTLRTISNLVYHFHHLSETKLPPRVLCTFWEYTLPVLKRCAFGLKWLTKGIIIVCFQKVHLKGTTATYNFWEVAQLWQLLIEIVKMRRTLMYWYLVTALSNIILRVYESCWTCKQVDVTTSLFKMQVGL